MEIGEISEEWDDDDWIVVGYEYDWDVVGYDHLEKQKGWNWGWNWDWVMNAGKKVVMAGIVISSAPVLLPPMLLFSAIGAAMSVPSGVVLASYACTHKLMSKLLPPPPPLPPNYELDEDEEEYDDDEEEEMKMSEDIKNQVEMRIELVEDEPEVYYSPPYKYEYNQVGIEREVEEEREVSSSSSSSSSENEDNFHVEETQVKQASHDAVNVKQDEPKKVLKEEKDSRGGANGGLHSHEELDSEEKIWEKIDAIRVIVGFKAPKRSSYVEEVKALYLFTGIQPPPAENHSHLATLAFLMSVIGVK